jgi:glycosyltransferase involved in cell wall biosynthesis
MFAGKPVVASDIPQHRECVEHNREALLYPVGDHHALAEAARSLLNSADAAAALGNNARRAAAGRFDIERIAAEHEALYEEIVAGGRG